MKLPELIPRETRSAIGTSPGGPYTLPMIAAYLHTLDPFLIQFTDSFGIRWYGLSYVAGFICAFAIMRHLAKRGRILIKPEQVGDFIFALVIGTLVGGRLGYCLFYRPDLFVEFTAAPPFWGVLAVWQGGMASHGGIIGLVLSCIYFGRKHKITSLHLIDLVALTGTIGIFFGRIANFINGELIGRPVAGDFKFAVKFPQELRDWDSQQLDYLAESLRPLGLTSESPYGLVEQAIAAIQAGNAEIATTVAEMLPARHPSQLYEAALEGLLIFIILGLIWRKPRKPGILGGWFLVIYPIVRIIGEQFRMPDAHIGFEALGLTRGQWLSAAMFAIGVVCLILWSKRDVPRIGQAMTQEEPTKTTAN